MPSDIKWENLELTECNRFGRKSIVFLGAFFLLMCSFILVYLMKSNEGDLPESEECLVYKDVSRTTSEYKQLDSKGMEVYCYCSSQNKYDVLHKNSIDNKYLGTFRHRQNRYLPGLHKLLFRSLDRSDFDHSSCGLPQCSTQIYSQGFRAL